MDTLNNFLIVAYTWCIIPDFTVSKANFLITYFLFYLAQNPHKFHINFVSQNPLTTPPRVSPIFFNEPYFYPPPRGSQKISSLILILVVVVTSDGSDKRVCCASQKAERVESFWHEAAGSTSNSDRTNRQLFSKCRRQLGCHQGDAFQSFLDLLLYLLAKLLQLLLVLVVLKGDGASVCWGDSQKVTVWIFCEIGSLTCFILLIIFITVDWGITIFE